MAWHLMQPFAVKTFLPSLGLPGVMKAGSFEPLLEFSKEFRIFRRNYVSKLGPPLSA
jgi:hypothetical protein